MGVDLYVIAGIIAVMYIMFEWNLSVYKPFLGKALDSYPKLSVLVPCRNEAARIEENLKTLLNQDYPDYEVLVLDDDSDDGTAEILKRMEAENPRLRYLKGKTLPPGWQGKNHACHQLSEAASGEWLLFVDADTRHEPQTLKRVMQTAVGRQASLVSTFPRQVFGSAGDALVVPLMFFILLIYLPMFFVAKRTWKWVANFSTACGQFLLVEAAAYREVGGHDKIRNNISEAPLLATHVKDTGRRVVLADSSPWVSCRMYRGFGEVFQGFSRSLFATMGGAWLSVVFFVVVQTYVFVWPYCLMAVFLTGGAWVLKDFLVLLFCLAVPLWIRYRIHTRFNMSRKWIGLHAVSILLYHLIMINSWIHYSVRKRTVWKDRSYANPEA